MMPRGRDIAIPTLVRIKPGALDRAGVYLDRSSCNRVALLYSEGLPAALLAKTRCSLERQGIDRVFESSVSVASLEEAQRLFTGLADGVDAVIGFGGGKALDTAKYVGYLLQRPFFSVPTSVSNDGFCSPQSSLTIEGKRFSLPSAMPFGVIVDTAVCLGAPRPLWHSGIGDLVSKVTAIRDWKLAFHHDGTPVDDFAALLSDATVFQFMARPKHDLEGIRLLATALMLNGVAMSVCGSSRPASGSEHLISHALDATSSRPRLHGLQVGMATYLVSHLHESESSIRDAFDATGFWGSIETDPFSRSEWEVAIDRATEMKRDFHTILATRDCTPELLCIIDEDPRLKACFVD